MTQKNVPSLNDLSQNHLYTSATTTHTKVSKIKSYTTEKNRFCTVSQRVLPQKDQNQKTHIYSIATRINKLTMFTASYGRHVHKNKFLPMYGSSGTATKRIIIRKCLYQEKACDYPMAISSLEHEQII